MTTIDDAPPESSASTALTRFSGPPRAPSAYPRQTPTKPARPQHQRFYPPEELADLLAPEIPVLVQRLLDIAKDGPPNLALIAIEKAFNRVYGRPQEFVSITQTTDDDTTQHQFDLAALSQEQRDELRAILVEITTANNPKVIDHDDNP